MSENSSHTGNLEALSAWGASAETLWSRIAPTRSTGTRRTILFTSTEHRSGTSMAAACAAAGLARNLQVQVLLVEIGAGSSTLASLLDLPEGPGFHELLCSGATPVDCVRGCGLEGLAVITAGSGVLPAGRLASEHARKLFEQLGAGRDFLLIDAAPIQEHPELHPILLHADEAVLVFEAERTQRDQARELKEIVSRAGVHVVGSILNRARALPFR